MGATRYQRIEKLISQLKKEHGEIIDNNLLKVGIIKFIGSEKRAIDGVMLLMKELNMVEDVDENRTRLK